jgi:hypothetical protein
VRVLILKLSESSHAVVLAALVCGLWAATAGAQQSPSNRFEITPFATYVFGGSFEVFDFEFGEVDFRINEHSGLGLAFDATISRSFQLELLYFEVDTVLEIDEGLFAEPFTVGDIDVSYYQAGVLWQLPVGQVKPFVVFSGGLARLDLTASGLDSETRPAFTFGGGVKVMFSEHVGLRAEGRVIAIALDGDDDRFRGCCRNREGDSITQGQVSAGLLFAF